MTHTPGPWEEYELHADDGPRYGVKQVGKTWGEGGVCIAFTKEDARFIASVPELRGAIIAFIEAQVSSEADEVAAYKQMVRWSGWTSPVPLPGEESS